MEVQPAMPTERQPPCPRLSGLELEPSNATSPHVGTQ